MKKITFFLFLIFAAATADAQKNKSKKTENDKLQPMNEIKVPLTASQWSFADGKVMFLEHKGVNTMKILPDAGVVELKDTQFKDGTIEFDVESTIEDSPSIYFHRKDDKEQEVFYLRLARANNKLANDAVQYAPVIGGVVMWDMYDQYQASAHTMVGQWNHIKLVISGLQMLVFVNDMNNPTLMIPKLEGNVTEGKIAFEDPSIIANLIIKPNLTEGLSPLAGFDLTKHDAYFLRNWKLSEPIFLPAGQEPLFNKLPVDSDFVGNIEAERMGLINLTRQFGKTPERRMVCLKLKFYSERMQSKKMQLGFSDDVWVFVNNQFAFSDKNNYHNANARKYPDGRISTLNSSFSINLKEGENELLIAVSNSFYGWGIIPRLEDLKGISFIK